VVLPLDKRIRQHLGAGAGDVHAVPDRRHAVRGPPFLAAPLLAHFSNLSAGLPHYGTTPGPIYFGADYVTQQKWRLLGLIASATNILIWVSVVGLVEDPGIAVTTTCEKAKSNLAMFGRFLLSTTQPGF
jgi:sodium:sulfate symporter-like transmembrane protein